MSRTGTRLITIAVIGTSLVLALGVGGCKKVPKIISAWPVANSERIVPEPPPPLVFPYRGTVASSLKAVTSRPLSVKVENSPAARPQTGISRADVVYETIAEGGITRFNCIFHSDVPDRIGPVRSARLSDLWIVPQYDGLFFFSGASRGVNAQIGKAKLPNLSEDAGVSKPYTRSTEKSPPHNLFLDGKMLYETAKSRDYKITSKPVPLQYVKRVREATVTVTDITIPFSQANITKWVYDSKTKLYARSTNSKQHFDQGNGKQITAENIVVMWVGYERASQDKVGSNTWDITLGGKGRATVFYRGQRFDCTWTADRKTPPRFKNKSGESVRLSPGRTWMHAIPLDADITMK